MIDPREAKSLDMKRLTAAGWFWVGYLALLAPGAVPRIIGVHLL